MKYFVSGIILSEEGNLGASNYIVDLDNPICDGDDIKKIIEIINEPKFIIMNWRRMEMPE